MKKFTKMLLTLGVSALVVACGNGNDANNSANNADNADQGSADNQTEEAAAPEETAAASGAISVVSREDGSGTREAFTTITKVKEDDVDNTVSSAIIQNGTDQVLSYVAGDPSAIGYISLGSLNDTVKALQVAGVEATEENVVAGDYELVRPFNIVTNKDKGLSEIAQDFVDFILSKDGQAVVKEEGYVPLDADKEYEGEGKSGQINIAGSTSVGPLMEKLAEKYNEKNPDVTINITQNGSGAGVQAAAEGTSDFGMASRDLKDSEEGVEATTIAQDGIAVIVNKDLGLDDISVDSLKGIYTGEITDWEDVK